MASSITSFFQVITRAAVQEGKLKLNKKFSRKHGNELSNMISLSVPTGQSWNVRLHRDGSGEIWLQDGFSKFMEDNGIGAEYVLIFKHEGDSKLSVQILDVTATEILYSCGSVSEKSNDVIELKIDETDDDCDDDHDHDHDDDDDDEDENEDKDDDDSSIYARYDTNSDIGRADSPDYESADEDSDDSSVEYLGSTIECSLPQVVPKPSKLASKCNENVGTSNGNTRARRCCLTGKKKQKMEGGVDTNRPLPQLFPEPTGFVSKDKQKKDVSRNTRGFRNTSQSEARCGGSNVSRETTKKSAARVGECSIPPAENRRKMIPDSFQALIQPHHLIRGIMRLPADFARAHMPFSRDIKLVVKGNKDWNVYYEHLPTSFMLQKGWHKFAKKNELEIGDICVFKRAGSDEDVKLKVKIKRSRH